MPAYLKFFELERSPFETESQSKVVLGTKALRDALARIRAGLDEGAARICVNGQSGLGKTSLARALPKLLDDEARVAVILHPSTSWNTIRSSIAKQWKVGEGGLARSNLLSFAHDRRLVLVLDQAETASIDILDHLDVLLSYRTEEGTPVVQSVLFANLTRRPESDPPPIIWWLDRIQTLELQFAPLPREGVGSYIQKHLKRAGWKTDSIFTDEASYAIHGYTGGIPREVDRVCEHLLSRAADQNFREIDALFVHEMLDDRAERNSNTYDTFEEMVMEDEFAGADVTEEMAPEPGPSIQESLEHFAAIDPRSLETESTDRDLDDWPQHESAFPDSIEGRDADSMELGDEEYVDPPAANDLPCDVGTGPDPETEAPTLELVDEAERTEEIDRSAPPEAQEAAPVDASMLELEAYLSRPPSDAELRELRSRGFGRILRIAAVLAIGLMLGGTLIRWLGSDAESEPTTRTSTSGIDTPARAPSDSNPTLFADPNGLTPEPVQPEPLARLRGPVVPGSTANLREARPTPDPNHAGTANPAAPDTH